MRHKLGTAATLSGRTIRLFRARDFDPALAKFTEALAQKPGDWLAQEYFRRCEEYKRQPPAEAWDGSYAMLTK